MRKGRPRQLSPRRRTTMSTWRITLRTRASRWRRRCRCWSGRHVMGSRATEFRRCERGDVSAWSSTCRYRELCFANHTTVSGTFGVLVQRSCDRPAAEVRFPMPARACTTVPGWTARGRSYLGNRSRCGSGHRPPINLRQRKCGPVRCLITQKSGAVRTTTASY